MKIPWKHLVSHQRWLIIQNEANINVKLNEIIFVNCERALISHSISETYNYTRMN